MRARFISPTQKQTKPVMKQNIRVTCTQTLILHLFVQCLRFLCTSVVAAIYLKETTTCYFLVQTNTNVSPVC